MTVSRKILELTQQRGSEIVYGVAASATTVKVDGATTAVTVPTLAGMVSGDYVAMARTGADLLVLGVVGGSDWGGSTGTTSSTGGRWVQYPDGTMIQWNRWTSTTFAINNA